MNPILKWGGGALGSLAALALLAVAYAYVASELIITKTYTPRAVAFRAASDPQSIARGAHLALVAGCVSCHGKTLTGLKFDDVPGTVVWSRNLRLLARSYTDTQFEQSIRQGIRSDQQSVLIMPSNAYKDMPDRDVSDILAYLRSLTPQGTDHPKPSIGLVVRTGLLLGKFRTTVEYGYEDTPSLDLGIQYAVGQHLAGIACAECHNTDLGGARADTFFKTPDLLLVASYERAEFMTLMRAGKATGNRELSTMSPTARVRFAHFTDDEINALYDYLVARGQKLTAQRS